MLLTAEQYFEQRRKAIDRYVQGEHAWFGDTSCALPALSCYNAHAVPWYYGGGDADCGHDRHSIDGKHSIVSTCVAPVHDIHCQGSN